jgi:hypothetical protein
VNGGAVLQLLRAVAVVLAVGFALVLGVVGAQTKQLALEPAVLRRKEL